MFGRPKFTFLIENNQTTFYAGSVVSGFVLIHLPKDLKSVKEVKVVFEGNCSVWWQIKQRKKTITYSSKQLYFKKTLQILENIPNNMLPKGEHKFPFAFVLPRDTPASFYFSRGNASASVYYYLMGKIKRYGLNFKTKVYHNINVLGNTRIQEVLPGINPMEPVVGRGSRLTCCWYFKFGPINGEVVCNKSVYKPGEIVLVNATVENLSGSDLTCTIIKLIRSVRLIVSGRSVTFYNTLVKQEFGGCTKRETWSMNNISIQIPTNAMPSHFPNCDSIDIRHFIEMKCKMWTHKNFHVYCEINVESYQEINLSTILQIAKQSIENTNGVSNTSYEPDQPAITSYPLPGQPEESD